MQMIINVILSAILALFFLLIAIGTAVPSWLNWILFIVAAVALILSLFSVKK